MGILAWFGKQNIIITTLEITIKSSSYTNVQGFPGGSEVKASPCNVGDLGLIPGEGNGNPLQYSCLENPIDGGAWQAACSPWGHKESDTSERLYFHSQIDCKN